MKNTTLKRFLSLVLALTMVMSYAAVPAAATGDDATTDPSETTHQCSFTQETARTEATCGTAGSVTLACECTQTTTQEIPATGEHTYGEYTVVTEATCGAAGKKVAVCSVCDDEKEEAIPATGEHSYENGVCSVCQQNKPCSISEGCDAPAHAEECPEKPQATQQEEAPVVCNGTENCAATTHETTCECYDPCAVLGCTDDAHHADCPYGPCTKTEGCELVKDHEGDCTGMIPLTGETEEITDPEAMIGDTKYATLAEAVSKAESGASIIVAKDITLSEKIHIPSSKTIILNLNGKTVSQSKACTGSYEMISNDGNLTITGNGKLSFTDTGSGDSNFGWGSYTIRNAGTLVVENGTIEHLGTQTPGTHCIQAIFQYSGSTTIHNGYISTPNYRAIRLWNGTMTINNGVVNGQIWVQTQKGVGATLTINNGTFAPAGADASAVYLTNDNNVANLTIKGGTFNGKLGVKDPDTIKANITGGTFTNTTGVSNLLALGYTLDETGKVVTETIEKVQESKTEISNPNNITEVTANAAVTGEGSTNVSTVISSSEVAAALQQVTDTAGATAVEISMQVEIQDYEDSSATTVLTFEVAPHIQPIDDNNAPVGDGVTVSQVSSAVSFRLPMPNGTKGKFAKVTHEHVENNPSFVGAYEILGNDDGTNCYIELKSSQFSQWQVEIIKQTAAEADGIPFASLSDAVADAESGDTIKLLENITLTDTLTFPAGKTVTLDLNGKTIAMETDDTNITELISNNGTLTINATEGGKITFKHKNGSTSFAANTILNLGTLTINGGTIENTTGGQSICYAVDNNSTVGNVSVTVNGGTLDSSSSVYGDGIRQFANSTSANNSVTVTGGTVSSIWMQNPSDSSTNNTADVKASLSISGGTVNAVYIEPSTGFTVSIIGGTFKTVSASQNNADDRMPKNFITGGTFKDGETVTDVTAYLPIGYTQDSTGKVVEKDVTVQSSGTNVTVSATIPTEDQEISVNAEAINEGVSVPTTDSKVQAAIAEIDGAAEATGVKVSLNLNITEYENTDGKITLTFDVAPHVQPVKVVDGTTINVGTGVTLKEVENPITFRLPMPDGTKGKIASVVHVHNGTPSESVNYVIQEEDGNCFVEITSKKFSEFIVSITSTEAVALLKSTNIAYSDLGAANNAATANETIVLLKDTTIASDKVLSITENVTLDLNGKTLTGTVVGTISMNGGTYYTYDSTTSDGKYKISAPTGSAYNSSNAVFAIATTGITIADGDVVLGWDMYTDANHTLTVSQGASFTIPAQKTLLLRKAAVVNGTLTVNGAFILEPNATVTVANNGQVNGTGSFELKTGATITGPANLNVITKVANSKVVYNSTTKVYSIAPDYAATVGTTGYYNLEEAINAATTSTTKTVTLEKDGVVNNNLEITGITIDMNNHVIKGTGSITSKGNVIIHKMGTAYSPVTITLETGDKAAFGTDGNVTITANPTNLHGYDSVKVTLIGSNGTSLSYYYFMRTGGDLKGSVTVKPTSEIITSGHVLSSSNTTPTYTVTAIKVNDKLGSSYTYGSTETITIESNGFHSCFSDVYVNGLKLATTAYEHKEGSTIITLKNSYLKTLSKGQYKVILTYADGNYSNEVSFYVVSAPKAAWNPQTGDMILPVVFVMIAAAAGLGVLVYLGKKKKK